MEPDAIVLELCRSRVAILTTDEKKMLEESSNLDFSKIRSVLAEHGKVQGVLYLLLLSVAAVITRQLGKLVVDKFDFKS